MKDYILHEYFEQAAVANGARQTIFNRDFGSGIACVLEQFTVAVSSASPVAASACSIVVTNGSKDYRFNFNAFTNVINVPQPFFFMNDVLVELHNWSGAVILVAASVTGLLVPRDKLIKRFNQTYL